MAKKTLISKKELFYKCPHCDLVMDFPVEYCTVCKDHHHVLFMGGGSDSSHPGICTQCFEGGSPQGRQWRRDNRTWAPNLFYRSSYDNPEWYDMVEEWKNMTIQFAWNEDMNVTEEF
jgi:hypothetical protein